MNTKLTMDRRKRSKDWRPAKNLPVLGGRNMSAVPAKKPVSIIRGSETTGGPGYAMNRCP